MPTLMSGQKSPTLACKYYDRPTPPKLPMYWGSEEAVHPETPEEVFALAERLVSNPKLWYVHADPGRPNEFGQYRRSISSLQRKKAGKLIDEFDPPGLSLPEKIRLLVFDLDEWGWPAGTNANTPPYQVAAVLCSRLFQVLKRPSCSAVVAFSGSHKIKGCKAKILLLTDRPVTWEAVGNLYDRAGADRSMLNPVSIAYFAPPILPEDRADPMPIHHRVVYVPGEMDFLESAPREGDTAKETWKRLHTLYTRLSNLDPGQPRHPEVNKAAFQAAGVAAGESAPVDIVVEFLTSAVQSIPLFAGRDFGDEIKRAAEDGYRNPIVAPNHDLLRNNSGAVTACPANLLAVLERDVGAVLRFNERGNRPELHGAPPWDAGGTGYPRALRDSDSVRCAAFLNREIPAAKAAGAAEALFAVAEMRRFDPVTEKLGSLPAWDGERRVDFWLSKFCGAPDTPLTRAYAAKTLISAVARAYDPGCKADSALTLVGAQGAFKSTTVRTLAFEDFYSDAKLHFRDPVRLAMAIHGGAWLHEIPEIEQFSKIDQAEFRDLLSTARDEFTPKYGRLQVSRPRRSIFIGTANEPGFLRDPHGSRRYWPVLVRPIDVGGLRGARDQLWAEAVERYRAGEPWHLSTAEERSRKTDAARFEIELVGFSAVRRHLEEHGGETVAADDLIRLLPPTGLMGSPAQHLGVVMRSLGWVRERVRAGGARVSVYRRPGKGAGPTGPTWPDGGSGGVGPEIRSDNNVLPLWPDGTDTSY